MLNSFYDFIYYEHNASVLVPSVMIPFSDFSELVQFGEGRVQLSFPDRYDRGKAGRSRHNAVARDH